MHLRGVLETAIYVSDLGASEAFYSRVLGLELIAKQPGRHLFYRCGQGVFLLFNPTATATETVVVNGSVIPRHGTQGAGHAAFRVFEAELPGWRARLREARIDIEQEVSWPQGGKSLYFRDPAGNILELATPGLWGFPEV